jgi:hypothetical protein
VDVHLFGGVGHVQVGVGERSDRFDCCCAIVI